MLLSISLEIIEHKKTDTYDSIERNRCLIYNVIKRPALATQSCVKIETSCLRYRSIEMHAVSSKIINHDFVEPNTVLYQSVYIYIYIYAVTIFNWVSYVTEFTRFLPEIFGSIILVVHFFRICSVRGQLSVAFFQIVSKFRITLRPFRDANLPWSMAGLTM